MINESKRDKTSSNHSATHLLHESLRQIVGKHVSQKGSLVNDKKLRFDYSSNEPLSLKKQKEIESLVNKSIRSNIKVEIKKMPYKEAIKTGAIALFGEKYPENVRVVSMKGMTQSELKSIELCGGTHIQQTGQIGLFKILNDVSVSSGIRRIEALTGEDAEIYCEEKINSLREVKIILKASDHNIIEKIENLKGIASFKKNKNSEKVNFEKTKILKIEKLLVYYDDIKCESKDLRNNADLIKKEFDNGIIILSSCSKEKVSVVVSVPSNLIDEFDSVKIIKSIISFLGGKGGGGRRDLSQGGAPLNSNFMKLKEQLVKLIT